MTDRTSYSSERITLRHGGRDRIFTVVTPENIGDRPDVLFYFHGSLQNGNVARNFTGRTFDDMAARTGTILIYPDGVERHFNDTRRGLRERTRELGVDDVGFTRTIVDRLRDRHDLGAIHACGYSNGGQMVLRLLHDAPGLLAGAATFAATMPAADNLIDGLGDPVPTPYLAIHGTGDHIVNYDGGVAGLDPAHTRGVLVSAFESAEYFADVNGLGDADHTRRAEDALTVDTWSRDGHPPVELWSITGMGHVVPTPKDLPSAVGPGTDAIVAADVVAEFFGWE